MVENEDFWEADVFITPPNDGLDSKEDSDDEEAPTKNIYLYRGTYTYMRDKNTEITKTSWNDNRPVLTV